MQFQFVKGATSRSVLLHFLNLADGSDGDASIVYNTPGLSTWFRRDFSLQSSPSSLAQLSPDVLSTGYQAGGFKYVNGGNFRWDPPDSAFASAANIDYVLCGATLAGYSITPALCRLVDWNQTHTYWARVDYRRDQTNSTDRYTVMWYRSGVWLTSGITSPTLQVVARDGTDLIASTAMTEIGSTGIFKLDEADADDRLTKGSPAMAIVTASIDSSTRTWADVIGRDSP